MMQGGRERYYHRGSAIDRMVKLAELGFVRVTYYPDMDGGKRCWIVEFK